MPGRVPLIDTRGIGELQKALRAADREIAREFTRDLKEAGTKVAAGIRSTTAKPYRTGQLRHSLKASVKRGRISLVNAQPYAALWDWGGSTPQTGGVFKFPRTQFITGPVKKSRDQLETDVSKLLSKTAARHGFRSS